MYDAWLEHARRGQTELSGIARTQGSLEKTGEVPVDALGAGSDFCPFLDFAGIPSIDTGFVGDYGVYHSLYDDFYWMKTFGDPTFEYHVTLAKVLGTLALRLDEADVLPFDYAVYAAAITRATNDIISRADQLGIQDATTQAVADASARLTASAAHVAQALRSAAYGSFDAATQNRINHDLASVEQALLVPEGLVGRPWYKHTIYAPGSYAGYAAEVLPGVNEALDRDDAAIFQQEAASLAAALTRASARLDEVAQLVSEFK